MLALLLSTATNAFAHADKLLGLINTYRDAPRACDGKQFPAAGPLAPSAALDRVKVSASGKLPQLRDALKDVGYQAARVQAISISGPSNPDDAMAAIRQHYCRPLLSQQYSAAGVSRHGNRWLVLLAQPVLAPDLGNWRQAGKQILQRVNAARATRRSCGKRHFAAAPPLAWNDKLATAARVHSADMARHNYFSHRARDGSDAGDRVRRAGYAWHQVGENIAAGQGSPQEVVSGWLASPAHCANIMKPGFTAMGAAYAINRDSEATIYWTQVFATS